MAEQRPEKRERQRAGAACGECNSRKTKCDMEVNQPCTKCKVNGRTCAVHVSKRGKYDRSKMHGGVEGTADSTRSATPLGDLSVSPLGASSSSATVGGLFTSSLALPAVTIPHLPEPASFPPVLPPPSDFMASPSTSQSEPPPSQLAAYVSPPGLAHDSNLGAEVEREPWVDLMTSSVEERDRAHAGTQDVQYVSDLFTLSHLLRSHWHHDKSNSAPSPERLHFPSSSTLPGFSINNNQLQYLSEAGCFTLPTKPVLDQIVSSYFTILHPLYPILNKSAFYARYENVFAGQVSLLLLWAILYVGVTHCPMETLSTAGFSTRMEAMKSFYDRGQALYSFGFERDKVTIVQFEFIMSQIWSGPEDSYIWCGRASNRAQSLGMHRTTKGSKMLEADQQSWRRLWWSIFIRDRHSAAATGRPFRIIEAFNDVEMPSPGDLQDGEDLDLFVKSIELAKIVGSVVEFRLSVQSASASHTLQQAGIYQRFNDWYDDLPRHLAGNSSSRSVFTTFLLINYHCWVIHLFRPASGSQERSEIASESAASATRLFEDLLQRGQVLSTPQFGVTCLFAAMAQHVLDRRTGDETLQRLSSHRLSVCMLVAKELSAARPVAQMFRRMFSLLDPATPFEEEPGAQSRSAAGMGSDHANLLTEQLTLHERGLAGSSTDNADYLFGDPNLQFFDSDIFTELFGAQPRQPGDDWLGNLGGFS